MLTVTKENLDKAKREMREKKDKRNVYVRDWREKQRTQKRKAAFVDEYVRVKYRDVYSEAINFYTTLNQTYPRKRNLCKTSEFQTWRVEVHKKDKKSTAQQETTRNMVLSIPLMSHSPPTANTETSTTAEIQQPLATPPGIGAELTIDMPPMQPETPLETDDQMTDRRIQEIIAELRDDPDLNGVFNDIETNNQSDEGIEVPTLEQELETDIGLLENEVESYLWS